jgi:hypothetical protein
MYAWSGGCTLLSVAQTYVGEPPGVRSVDRTSRCTWDHRTYATFEYPLDNTWTYETPSGPMCKNQWMYARVAGRLHVRQGVGRGFYL